MHITIHIRSGIVCGVIEAIFLLLLAPILSRATARIYNYMTTRLLLSGKHVRIRDTSTSVEDLIPRVGQLFRALYKRNGCNTSLPRQFVTLFISLVLTTGMFLLGVFTDGSSLPVMEMREIYIWNGGNVADATARHAIGPVQDVPGMSRVRLTCVEALSDTELRLHAMALLKRPDGRHTRVPEDFLCVDGVQTDVRIGLDVSLGKEAFNPPELELPPGQDVMEGEKASFQFLSFVERPGAGDYCRVAVKKAEEAQEPVWTFSREDMTKARFAARAVRRKSEGDVVLQAGVAYRFSDGNQCEKEKLDENCSQLSMKKFASNRFTAEIREVGVELNETNLELVVADMLMEHSESGYGRVDSQDIVLRSFYAGLFDTVGHTGNAVAAYSSRRMRVQNGTKQVTVMSQAAVVGLMLTVVGTVLLVGVSLALKPCVRMTSPTFVSAVYRSNREQRRDCCSIGSGVARKADLLEIVEIDGRPHVRPVEEIDYLDEI